MYICAIINTLLSKEKVILSSEGLSLYNKDGKVRVKLTDSRPLLSNKEGKELVYIGPIKDRPNDGLINIYDFKGDHRSYTAD